MLLGGSRNMRGRVEEDLDEYEDDYEDGYRDGSGDEYEDEDDEEEAVQEDEPLSEEAIKYLNLRDKLKERLRSKLRKENGVRPGNSRDQIRAAPLERFGSFFGPSKPVIANRVIQESKSFLETQHLAAKASTSQSEIKVRKAPMSSSSGTKNGMIIKPRPPLVKSKAQIIKATRDYSFLLSDDMELPKPSNNPGPSKNSASRPDARSAQVPTRSSQPSSHPSGKKMNGHEPRMNFNEQRMNSHEQRMNGQEKRNAQPNKQLGSSSNGRPAQSTASQKFSSCNNKGSAVSSDSRRHVDLRKQPQLNRPLSSSNGNGHARPAGPVRSAPPKAGPLKKPLPSSERRVSVGSVERRGPVAKIPAVLNNSTSIGQRMPVVNGQRIHVAKSQASGASNRLERKPNTQRSSDGRILKKENALDSRNQMTRPQKQDPYRANSQRDAYSKKPMPAGQSNLQRFGASGRDQHSRKRRAEEFEEDQIDISSEIRKMFGRPSRYVDDDDDDVDNMEVGFDMIQQEEKRSARIARKEDDEELIKIMEEERLEKERQRRRAKMRKMGDR